jgi:D-sedoheptulose 7-phosphate isomerase
MTPDVVLDRDLIAQRIRSRNEVSTAFFTREAHALARVSSDMARRFRHGGRLLAFGGPAVMSDAQHVAVEFTHPVLAGKRALPAVDVSVGHGDVVPRLARAEDIVIGFAPPTGDPFVAQTLRQVEARGALCLALPGSTQHFAMVPPSTEVFVHQEVVEMLYHVLWESVHVFLEHDPVGTGGGAAAFLYPFLGDGAGRDDHLVGEVAVSITAKAACVAELRTQVAADGDVIAAAVTAMHGRIAQGGTVLTFGNGGSATDATDLASDLLLPPNGSLGVPAISLAADPATLTGLANDLGIEAVFARQLIALGQPRDVAFAISTSGGSANILVALQEARRRGMLTVALVGYRGGEIARRGLADHVIVVDSDQIPRIQEVQATVYHVMVESLAKARRA